VDRRHVHALEGVQVGVEGVREEEVVIDLVGCFRAGESVREIERAKPGFDLVGGGQFRRDLVLGLRQ
jgi:hypothetical protein